MTCTVLDSSGTSYTLSGFVLDSSGTSYTMTSTALDSSGTPYIICSGATTPEKGGAGIKRRVLRPYNLQQLRQEDEMLLDMMKEFAERFC